MEKNNLRHTILKYINEKNMNALKDVLSKAEEIEILQAFNRLSSKNQVIAFRLLSKKVALDIFENLNSTMQANLINSFTDENIKELIDEMNPDDRVRLFDELPAIVVKKLLNSLSPEERKVTNLLMGYKPETAGRIMTTEYISLKKDMTVKAALEKIKKEAHDKETIYTLYVTDSHKKLEGVLSLKEILTTEEEKVIEDIMVKQVVRVETDTDQEIVSNLLQDLNLLSVPVVDAEYRLVGIVTVDDALDIIRDETTEDMYKSAGLSSVKEKETLRSDTLVNGSFLAIWKIRIPILLMVLAGGFLAGLIVEGFEKTLEAATMIAFFIPLIMDMGGSVGGQSTTLFARAFVLGQIKPGHFLKQLGKEAMVGLSIGAVIGFFAYFGVGFWLGNWNLAIAVSLALAVNCLIASSAGFLVPNFLIKIGADQAAGSGPIITSIKDITGLLVYFLLIMLFLDIESMSAITPYEAVHHAIEALGALENYAYKQLPNAAREAMYTLQNILEGMY
ncbi:MAG: magnesium transporter [Defluviitaleaceae bacterium]|nr:magnesium transporter [Defluviitaleaceae bacterium]